MIWVKTMLFTLFLPGAVTVVFPFLLLQNSNAQIHIPMRTTGVMGLTAIILGSAVYVWTVSDFARRGEGTPAPIDPPRNLIRKGLYRFSRNPMYIGVIAILSGEALVFGSWLLLGYAILVFISFHSFVVLYEEPRLHRRFGKIYEEYRNAVPRWIPVRPKTKNQRRLE